MSDAVRRRISPFPLCMFAVAVSVLGTGGAAYGQAGVSQTSQVTDAPAAASGEIRNLQEEDRHSEAAEVEDEPNEELDEAKGLFRLPLGELMAMEVTSVTGTAEAWFTSPAAVTVITAEDIRRSGHRSLAEVLRVVPGMQVARLNSHQWSVSSRGFSEVFSSKLLVLIDGRTVYSPLFAGVYWDVQDVPLEDIERIEVIRGPGATIWGANAVNGVINVTTKSAKNTQGGLLSVGGGTAEHGFGLLRYGFALDDRTWMRVYGKYSLRDRLPGATDEVPHDDWDLGQVGFRLDRESVEGYSLTVQGDVYHSDRLGQNRSEPIPVPPYSRTTVGDAVVMGANVLFRLSREMSEESGWTMQGYYDRVERDVPFGVDMDQDTFDLEFRHYFPIGDRHSIICGIGYRHVVDKHRNSFRFRLDPSERSTDTFSAFVQDTVTLVEDRLTLMLGSKFEHNDYTGFEGQPSIRLTWTPDDRQTIWGAVSRAVRTPSRVEHDLDLTLFYIPFPRVMPFKLIGNPDFDSETLIAYEIGYRVRPSDDLSLDIAAFFNDYDKLNESRPSPTNAFAIMSENAQTAETYGVEVAATWDVLDTWRLIGGYSFLKLNFHGPEDERREGRDPEHQFKLLSELDITQDLELNAAMYYVDSLPNLDVSSYVRIDLGLIWRPTEDLELAMWGQNLTDSRHLEFVNPSPGGGVSALIERGVYASIRYSF